MLDYIHVGYLGCTRSTRLGFGPLLDRDRTNCTTTLINHVQNVHKRINLDLTVHIGNGVTAEISNSTIDSTLSFLGNVIVNNFVIL